MNILAIETSSSLLSVAAKKNDGTRVDLNFSGALRHVENLTAYIKQVLERIHLKKEELDLLSCGIGPGSFTGLRIGLSAMKGLAAGLGKKIVGVSSLDIIAGGIQLPDGNLCIMLDAKRERIYTATYRFNRGICKKMMKDSVLPLVQLLKETDEKTVFAGDGLLVYGDKLKQHFGTSVFFLRSIFWYPRAADLIRCVEDQGRKIKYTDIRKLEPAYLRLSEAEERRREHNK